MWCVGVQAHHGVWATSKNIGGFRRACAVQRPEGPQAVLQVLWSVRGAEETVFLFQVSQRVVL